jgi:cytochrome c
VKIFNLMTLCAVASVALVSTAAAQSADRGKTLFTSECAACHSVTPGQNGIGPSLAGVYGMHAALQTANIVWTDDQLEKFLRDPEIAVAGTKMPHPGTEMHMGMPSPVDRGDLIAYLRSLPRS